MKIRIAQLFVGRKVEENRDKLLRILHDALRGEWVLFPEGVLSGYNPDEADYLSDIDAKTIDDAIDVLAAYVQRKPCHCIFGSATRVKKQWFNSVFEPSRLCSQAATASGQGSSTIIVSEGSSLCQTRCATEGKGWSLRLR